MSNKAPRGKEQVMGKHMVFCLFIILFIYLFWLCHVFIAVQAFLSCVLGLMAEASRGRAQELGVRASVVTAPRV